jgi:hypothetical protein
MATRMGTEVEKSWALAHVHIAYMERQFERLHTSPKSSLLDQHEAACGACVHLLAYLGWLRSGETFHGHQDDYLLTEPVEGPTRNLPPGIGAIEVRLLAATKSDPTVTADVMIAFTTFSGLSLGRWMKRLQRFTIYDPTHGLFSTAQQPGWDSRYFRETYAYPFLEMQRLEGELTLKSFGSNQGKRIRDKIYSMHSWR